MEYSQKVSVSNGILEMTFGTKEEPLPKGIYSLSFKAVGIVIHQEDEVKKIVGNGVENLCGRYAYLNWGLGKDVQVKKLMIFEVR